MTVMIVDDNASVRSMIRTLLHTTVDSFCECSDGSEALKSYEQYHPDWVLMDIMMKRVDGFQATKEILSEFPNAKIIMITQHNDPKLKQKAQTIGATEFVLKEHLLDIEHIIHRKPIK
ncbi:MAG: response regulator transcription factor [Ignavibacteriae bacterium]|nr:response regulator transcription factor [Ignavibacteriota bacterium]